MCCRARLGGRLSLNSFIQTRQVYTYEIPMGNRVRIIASQTHTRLPNGWRFCPITIPMGTLFIPYPYPNRGIPHGLTGIGSPLTSLDPILDFSREISPLRAILGLELKGLESSSYSNLRDQRAKMRVDFILAFSSVTIILATFPRCRVIHREPVGQVARRHRLQC
jgi:hypothetical protein